MSIFYALFSTMLRDSSIYGDSFVFWPLSQDFFIYENSSFGRFVQMVEVFCLSDSFVQNERNNQMAAKMLPIIPSLYAK